MEKRPRAILFDLDETLSDRSLAMQPYARQLYADFSHALAPIEITEMAAQLRTADGNGYRPRHEVAADILRLLPWTAPPSGVLLSDHWQQWFPFHQQPREGALALLDALRAQGIALGLITNGLARGQHAKLDRLGVRAYFDSIVVSETVGVEKPDARIFALALAELGCAAHEAWDVGDHPINDIIGARAAGLRPFWLRGIHPWPAEHAEPADQIARLADLLAALAAAA